MLTPTRPWFLGLGLTLFGMVDASPARATELVVTDAGDTLPGGAEGQLRRAIGAAGPGDIIVVRVTEPIVLGGGAEDDDNAEGDLDIVAKSITIQGAGPGVTVIDAANASRVFHVHPTAALALVGLTVRGGVANRGGGIRAEGTTSAVTLVHVELTGNHATVEGGGISASGALSLSGVTVAGNTADQEAGGIAANGPTTIVSTTVSGNSARDVGGGVGIGFLASASLANVTITDNAATNDTGDTHGGGVASFSVSTLQNTIIAGNRVGSASLSDGPDCSGDVTSLGYNLVGNNSGCGFVPRTGDLVGLAAALGGLAHNGGPTRTHALLPTSPALDAGSACASTDQRGVIRPQGARCDIGAFERRSRPFSNPWSTR